MTSKLHAIAGVVALLCVASFWVATLISELFLDAASVVVVKQSILAAMAVLVPAMAAVGASGFALGRHRSGRLVAAKQRRMRFIAVNGLAVLLPSAVLLARWAAAGRFDAAFYALQALELAAGAANIALLLLNLRDGLRLAGRRLRATPGTVPGP